MSVLYDWIIIMPYLARLVLYRFLIFLKFKSSITADKFNCNIYQKFNNIIINYIQFT